MYVVFSRIERELLVTQTSYDWVKFPRSWNSNV